MWDVVDADLNRKPAVARSSLSLEHHQRSPRPPSGGDSSAASVDVWRGTHAAVLIFDPRKRWTFQYCLRQLEEAPAGLPILLAANFADCCGSDGVQAVHAEHTAHSQPQPHAMPAHAHNPPNGQLPAPSELTPPRGSTSQPVAWAEVEAAAQQEGTRTGRTVVCLRCSMLDCTGLLVLHSFFQLPYYLAKRQALQQTEHDTAQAMQRAEAQVLAMAGDQQQGSAPPSPAVARRAEAPTPQALAPPANGGSSGSYRASSSGGFSAGGGSLSTTPYALPPSAATPTTTPPRLAPPPPAAHNSVVTSMPPTTSCSTPLGMDMSNPSALASIDDSFFDDVDAPAPVSAAPSCGQVGYPSCGSAATVAAHAHMPSVTTLTHPASVGPGMSTPQADHGMGDERDEDDMLPLLDDPDRE